MKRLLVMVLFVPSVLAAQQRTGAVADTIFLHAQRMVAEGQGDAGRAIVQTQLDSAPTGSSRYVEALYFRAVVASTAADAERDLRKIIINYPLSAWTAEALMRLSQLEMARGDNTQALAHLQRVVAEHPNSPNRGRADFWLGRVYFEQGNAPAACARLADGLRSTPASQAELHNQLDYLNQRCAGVDTTRVAAEPPGSSAKAAHATPAAASPGKLTPAATPPVVPTPTPRPVRARAPASAPAAPAAPASPASTPAAASGHAVRYTVQVAAYSTQQAANAMRARLTSQGYDARVVGTRKPFRVRVGRYVTRTEAATVQQKLHGFVTEAEPR